ncbi:MAG: AAA family ATPase [Candidatus Eisenbacteria bacterium]
MTYESFFGFNENPFGVTPDPRFFFSSQSHRDALAYLRYTLGEHKGFAAVIGEVGVGKTTVVKKFVETLTGRVDAAVVLNPNLSFKQFLTTVAREFGLSVKGKSKAELLIDLEEFLSEAGRAERSVILIIDEAQNLPAASLEEIRMLSNIESESKKLLQIALVGQPELGEVLSLKSLRQLRQRIPGLCVISPLSRGEVEEYVRSRLLRAGAQGESVFARDAIDEIYGYSGGIPRKINFVCDRALLLGFVDDVKIIGKNYICTAEADLEGRKCPGAGADSDIQAAEGLSEAGRSAA